MSWKPWKSAEKQAAKILGGQRRTRVTYSESCEDVHHMVFAIEVKYGKQIPKFVRSVGNNLVIYGDIALFPLGAISSMSLKSLPIKKEKRTKGLGFLLRGLEQALSYSPNRVPLLCLKPDGYRGMVGCMYVRSMMNE